MRDLQDWFKKVELDAKAVQRAADIARRSAASGPAEAEPQAGNGVVHGVHVEQSAPTYVSRPAPLPPRKGRGPRREESREELLSRLLDPTLTLEETARMLEVCPTTVRRYTNKGILPHERSRGNQRRFKLSSVLAFMEAQTRPAPPEQHAREQRSEMESAC